MRDAIELLEYAIERFTVSIGPPLYIPENGKERFRYTNKSPILIQVLKSIRIVSTLNASLCLLKEGYVQEIGVLLRTVDDFIKEITFMQEAIQGKTPTEGQKRFIENFFEEPPLDIEERLKDTRQRSWVPRKKICASISRIFSEFGNPFFVRQITRIISTSLDGYVHGHYQHIMELYEGSKNGRNENFRLRGMLGTQRIENWRWQISAYIHRALNTFTDIAINLELNDMVRKLQEKRKAFEESSAYKLI